MEAIHVLAQVLRFYLVPFEPSFFLRCSYLSGIILFIIYSNDNRISSFHFYFGLKYIINSRFMLVLQPDISLFEYLIGKYNSYHLFQVASQETYGTLGAIVRSQTGNRQVGFLTNRHVAVDLDYPNQKMFHPLPPTLGPGVYLGAVERATSFITDELWYGIFAGINPGMIRASESQLTSDLSARLYSLDVSF